MGLDMYLHAKKYISKIDWNNSSSGNYVKTDEYTNVVESADLMKVQQDNDVSGATVSVGVAYWRKANQIHNWFVTNCQNNEDDCGEYYVSHDKLNELVELCRKALFEKNPNLLPPSSGFFFGSTDIDEWYWNDIKNTITQLKRVSELSEFPELSFYYQSSW
jgi:hypothetical protein